MGMLTNFGSMALDRIHNTLKVRMVENFKHAPLLLLDIFEPNHSKHHVAPDVLRS
jgi:hypothetical protein